MSQQLSFFGRLWAKQYGNQFAITAIASGASAILVLLCAVQLFILQDQAEWADYTGLAILGISVGLIVFLVAFPEFMRFKGYVATLEELMAITSNAEIRRRMADGVLAAEALGAGHLEQWNAFLSQRGLRR